MTSANFFNGYAADKPTSRVLNPPGGRSNNIFGGYEEPVKPVQLTPQQEARNNKAHQSGDGNLFGGKPANPITGESNQAKPKNQRSGFNPITGQSYGDEDSDRQNRVDKHEAKQAKEASDKAAEVTAAASVKLAEEQERQQQIQNKPIHTSTKVHQPPGGKSTALW
jgi:hypothetical protein